MNKKIIQTLAVHLSATGHWRDAHGCTHMSANGQTRGRGRVRLRYMRHAPDNRDGTYEPQRKATLALHEFLSDNESDLIERCRLKSAQRPLPKDAQEVLKHGIPIFLGQLIRTLAMEQTQEPMRSRQISGPAGGGGPVISEMGATAALHGRELLNHGFTIDQVVHAYGDACQAITDLAAEHRIPFQIDEFRTLNRCLDNAIADAVTEYSYQHDVSIANKQAQEGNERLGILMHELRNHLQTATMAFTAIQAGNVGASGATARILQRELVALGRLVDGSVFDVRMQAGVAMRVFSLASFIAYVQISAALEADRHDCRFVVSSVDPDLAIVADRYLLSAAVGNLLQNAFKFTQPRTNVTLNAYATADRILIDVEDHCGGLHSSDPEELFAAFAQGGADKRGRRLGLSIVRRSVEAHRGILRVRDQPGVGCVFTIDLPRHATQEEGLHLGHPSD
ncbi:MAG TPA: HAMP domain-containing sensor histidine kinase [Burkholderiales bacterium]|nr:HAMP domain-containing sensor histidine kinase [Burkholderiales bacterium]